MKQGIFFIGKKDVLDILKKEPDKKVKDYIEEMRNEH